MSDPSYIFFNFFLQGENPSWYLSRIYVEDLQKRERYLFLCEKWLAVEYGDGRIDRILPVATAADLMAFSYALTSKMAQDFCDTFIWLSVIWKRPHDTFTRIERATCCLVLLLTTMVTSAMFYLVAENSIYVMRIGSVIIDYKAIIIGVKSSLIVWPVNLALEFVFRNSKRGRDKVKRPGMENEISSNKTTERKKPLSSRWVYVAWLLSVTVSLTSVTVIILYSMHWGDKMSKQWILSAFTGFCQSVFVIQPLKLVVAAIIFSAIFKRNNEDDRIIDSYRNSQQRVLRQEKNTGEEGAHLQQLQNKW